MLYNKYMVYIYKYMYRIVTIKLFFFNFTSLLYSYVHTKNLFAHFWANGEQTISIIESYKLKNFSLG